MAKTSQSTNFRKFDVDELDEDKFQDAAVESTESKGPSETEIQNLLNSKKNGDALKLLLLDPPFNAGPKEKTQHYGLMLRVMSQFKTAEIDGTLKELSDNDIDVLMKYVYRGFSEPTDSSCALLLNWHEKVLSIGGFGCIMRVMTDRKAL